jgi:hypothetical protein
MSEQSIINRLQQRLDAFDLLVQEEDALTARYNAFPVHERSNDEARAVAALYRDVRYQRILANAKCFHARMDLFYATGDNDQRWPARLRHLHPGKKGA